PAGLRNSLQSAAVMTLAPDDSPQNPLYERYASREMRRIFSARNRYGTWRRLWIALAEGQRELGLPITEAQIAALRQVAGDLDLARVAEIERRTRHDVMAHLRHFAEQADAVHPGAGGILHLGATSAFLTDNTDVLLMREGLELLRLRLGSAADARDSDARLYAPPARAAHDGGETRLPLAPGPARGPCRDRAPLGPAALPGSQGDDRHASELPDPFLGRSREGARSRPPRRRAPGGHGELRAHRADLYAKAGQPGPGDPRRDRGKLPQAGHGPAPVAGPGRAFRALRRRAGGIVRDGLQAQPRARGAD